MKALFFSLALIGFTSMAMAQDSKVEKAPITKSKLEKQFEHLKSSSNTWQGYEVVDIKTLDAFWKSVQETVAAKDRQIEDFENAADAKLKEVQQEVVAKEQNLQVMQNKINLREQEIQENMHAITHLNVLGIAMPKQTYVWLSGGIILMLLVALGIMAVQYKSSKRVTIEKRDAYDEVALELADYKKTVRERDIKLKRELQTERNLVADLKEEMAVLKRQTQV
jgi:hypothetical protein